METGERGCGEQGGRESRERGKCKLGSTSRKPSSKERESQPEDRVVPWRPLPKWKCLGQPYLGMGEKMLSPARNFLMVPLDLNQLCRFSCWVFRKSLLRCFHCWEVNIPRILWGKGKHGDPGQSLPGPKEKS